MPSNRIESGRTLGRIRPQRAEPPPALPAVQFVRAPVGSSRQPWREVLRDMIVAYKEATDGRNMGALMERIDGAWESRVKEVVGLVMDEGMSGRTYVAFACKQVQELRGRVPFPSEIFSVKSAVNWLRAYRKDAAGLIDMPAYVASDERRRLYAAQVRG
jgi:hypothetical protein